MKSNIKSFKKIQTSRNKDYDFPRTVLRYILHRCSRSQRKARLVGNGRVVSIHLKEGQGGGAVIFLDFYGSNYLPNERAKKTGTQ